MSAIAQKYPLGTRVAFPCPVCDGGSADVTYKLDKHGEPRWFVGCWRIGCGGGARYLDRLAATWDLSEGQTPETLAVEVMRRYGRRRRRAAEPLPSMEEVNEWARRLMGVWPPQEYLTVKRGISMQMLSWFRVGWDGRRLIFPMLDGREEIAAAKHRQPRDGAQMIAWAGSGRKWPLYPVPTSEDWILLVAGELDALRARTAGLPAVSVPLGAGYWDDRWTADVSGRRVVVAFDVGEEKQAAERVEALRAAGVHTRRFDLRRLGLGEKGDISDYLNGGGDPAALRPRRIVKRRRNPLEPTTADAPC